MPATIAKKRKRDRTDGTRHEAMDVFRRHFETQFAPLKVAVAVAVAVPAAKAKIDTADEEAEWKGLSDTDDRAPQVVEFDAPSDPLAAAAGSKLPKSILKAFMSSRPPCSSGVGMASEPVLPPSSSFSDNNNNDDDDDDDESPAAETALLKNDLALQRLLRESHLLSASGPSLEARGKNRLKALDSRVRALGGRDIGAQNHPMRVQRGIAAARRLKEVKRRAHAKEAGIVLEREVRVGRVGERERERRPSAGFGPSVGRFRSGTLVLSRRDVMDIEGRTGGGKEGRGGRGAKGSRGGKSGKSGKKRR